HERHPRAAGGRLGVRALRPAVPAGGRAHGRHGHLRRGARAPARGADRDRAGRGLRPAARARREPRAGLARGSWPRCGARGRRPARTARRTGSPMSDSYLRNVIEAALLAAGAPLPVAELTRLFDESARPSVQQVRAVVAALAEEYSGRGIELKETAGGFRIQVRRELAGEISRLWPERASWSPGRAIWRADAARTAARGRRASPSSRPPAWPDCGARGGAAAHRAAAEDAGACRARLAARGGSLDPRRPAHRQRPHCDAR